MREVGQTDAGHRVFLIELPDRAIVSIERTILGGVEAVGHIEGPQFYAHSGYISLSLMKIIVRVIEDRN